MLYNRLYGRRFYGGAYGGTSNVVSAEMKKDLAYWSQASRPQSPIGCVIGDR